MTNLLIVPREARLPTSRARSSDLAGMLASLGCAIHCAAMPFVIGYLPSLGLTWMAGESFHKWMAVICAVIALVAFVPGWRRHRRFAPMMLGVVGIALLSSAAFVLEPCCEHGASTQATTLSGPLEVCDECNTCVTETVAKSDTPQFWDTILRPYVTPFGGIVLIVAHLLNHRFGCRCCTGEQHCQSSTEES